MKQFFTFIRLLAEVGNRQQATGNRQQGRVFKEKGTKNDFLLQEVY
ncbi:MAG: hypothetical protein SXA11_07165 [Cyanobacteriota bacterium]|nr:hypothetical protein [Cyanobacteriota bacterium]